jgi:hypothetical protein
MKWSAVHKEFCGRRRGQAARVKGFGRGIENIMGKSVVMCLGFKRSGGACERD